MSRDVPELENLREVPDFRKIGNPGFPGDPEFPGRTTFIRGGNEDAQRWLDHLMLCNFARLPHVKRTEEVIRVGIQLQPDGKTVEFLVG